MKTFRLLKREQADQHRIEKLFARKSDEVLLGAIANPEHSEAAVQILRSIAEQRGLQERVQAHWEQTEESMYVAPFGKRPTFEEVLAAPGRRRKVYRSLQFVMLACMVAAWFATFHYKPHAEWIQEGIDAGQFDPATVARLREWSPAPTDEDIYNYLIGFSWFAQDLRQNYIDVLIGSGLMDAEILQQYQQTEGPERQAANYEIIGNLDELSYTSGETAMAVVDLKESVFQQTRNAYVDLYQAGLDADETMVPAYQPYVEALNKLSKAEVGFITENGGNATDLFDHFAYSATVDTQVPRSATPEVVGIAIVVGGLLAWLLVGIYTWTKPYRILLLRPFQARKLSRPLKRFVKKNVSFYGHTITLADKFLKESWFMFVTFWIPRSIPEIFVLILFFFPPIRQFKRWIRVSSSSSYQFLKKRLSRRFTMNMFWQNTFSGDKLLKVKCSDTWWKQCVDLLMFSSQLIIVDLSWVKVGTEWELDKINSRDLEGKTVFIVSEDAADYAREVMARFWPSEEAPPPLHVYRKSGKLLDKESYNRDVARIISGSHLWPQNTRMESLVRTG